MLLAGGLFLRCRCSRSGAGSASGALPEGESTLARAW
jgi:hypothetical protein